MLTKHSKNNKMFILFKRLIDLFVAILLLIVLSPLFVITALLIQYEDNGPIFYTQKRVGFGGKLFDLYKFRSMKHNVEGLFYTQENDPRITKIGKFLRKLSLDELPQLINVLKGDMSLVGPRPDVEIQQELYSIGQKEKRNSVLPGITGLAQAKKRSLATFQERIDLDLEYVELRSIVLDFKIMLLTAITLFKKNKN